MICSGQMTRAEALQELAKAPYPNEVLLREDMEFVAKKFGLSLDELRAMLAAPPRSHYDFPNNELLYARVKKIARAVLGSRNLHGN